MVLHPDNDKKVQSRLKHLFTPTRLFKNASTKDLFYCLIFLIKFYGHTSLLQSVQPLIFCLMIFRVLEINDIFDYQHHDDEHDAAKRSQIINYLDSMWMSFAEDRM